MSRARTALAGSVVAAMLTTSVTTARAQAPDPAAAPPPPTTAAGEPEDARLREELDALQGRVRELEREMEQLRRRDRARSGPDLRRYFDGRPPNLRRIPPDAPVRPPEPRIDPRPPQLPRVPAPMPRVPAPQFRGQAAPPVPHGWSEREINGLRFYIVPLGPDAAAAAASADVCTPPDTVARPGRRP